MSLLERMNEEVTEITRSGESLRVMLISLTTGNIADNRTITSRGLRFSFDRLR
jgi:hypothetical protein